MSQVNGSGGSAKGRGRGRAYVEPSLAPPSPGASSPEDQHINVGRGRAAIGRGRGELASRFPSTIEKPKQGLTLGDSSQHLETVEKMADMELISLAPRPGYGTLGRKYRMLTNHFEIGIVTDLLAVHHYHIEICLPDFHTNDGKSRRKLKLEENRSIFWKCFFDNRDELGLTGREDLYKVAYDNVSVCFTLDPLNITFDKRTDKKKTYEMEVLISNKDNPVRVKVSIHFVGRILVDFQQVTNINLAERSCTPIQVVDILLRQYRSCPFSEYASMYYPFRNTIYLIPGTGDTPVGTDLGRGMEIWKGMFTSAHVAEGNLAMVNVDVCHTAFYKFSTNEEDVYRVIQYLCDVLNYAECQGKPTYRSDQLTEDTCLPEVQRKIFEREIEGIKVCVDYQVRNSRANSYREYCVHSVDKSAADCMFKINDGRLQSVAEYYKDNYGPLKYPRMFTLKIGPKQKPGGPRVRYIYLPIEHCYIAKNQKVMKKLTEIQTALIIRTTCMAPADRKTSIEQILRRTRFDEDPYLKNFGLQLKPKMVAVVGRVLNPPSIVYGENKIFQPRDGVWRASGSKFHKPSEASGIAAVAFSHAPDNAEHFIAQLMNCCRQCGMQMPGGDQVFFHLEMNTSPQRVEKAFTTVLDKMKLKNVECQMIIVFLQQKGMSLYYDVKYVAEIQMGIITQCVVSKTVDRCTPDILEKLAFKINMKLGGINCIIKTHEQTVHPFFNQPTLVLGIDVTHPGPTERRKPSVASIVGNIDLNLMRYVPSIKIQKLRTENLVYLADKVQERILAFYKATQQKPARIIVYRDGVSEGQFQQVLREEWRDIRQACAIIDPTYRPKITFIVVQKRHHTRLFPEDPSEGCGKHRNVFPGTVVDSYITPSDDFLFYLCSHASIQGTSRPARYTVLKDDSNFSADDLQMFSYYLCHCFSRCSRAVSIPAPVYYAHLACTRARAHLQARLSDTLSDTASDFSGDSGGVSSSWSEEELTLAITVEDKIRKEMYYI